MRFSPVILNEFKSLVVLLLTQGDLTSQKLGTKRNGAWVEKMCKNVIKMGQLPVDLMVNGNSSISKRSQGLRFAEGHDPPIPKHLGIWLLVMEVLRNFLDETCEVIG